MPTELQGPVTSAVSHGRSAVAQAKALYEAQGACFERNLATFLLHGHVFSAPDRLLMIRPACSRDPLRWVSQEEADAWFVHLAVGQGALAWFVEWMPYHLPMIGWQRDLLRASSPVRFFKTETVISKLRRL